MGVCVGVVVVRNEFYTTEYMYAAILISVYITESVL